jgi:hypothetical protein
MNCVPNEQLTQMALTISQKVDTDTLILRIAVVWSERFFDDDDATTANFT